MTQKYRKGDIVTVKATIQANFDGSQVFLRPYGHYTDIFVDPEVVTMVQPYFAPGERVQKKERNVGAHHIRGTVVAISEDSVWVKFDHGKHGTVPAVELEPSTEVANVAAA